MMAIRFKPLAAAIVFVLLQTSLSLAQSTTADHDIPILGYHRFDPVKAGPTTTITKTFEQQLDWLEAHHYRVVSLRSVVAGLRGTAPAVAAPAAVITVDDGHVSVYTQLYPIIQRRHLPVTLFIYPSAISSASYALTWSQLVEMIKSGLVDVQSHTFWHPDFRKERAHRTPQDYRAFVDLQLGRSKAVLERQLGQPVDMLAWPYGIVDADLEAAAARAGYDTAFAFAGGLAGPGADFYAIPRIPVANQAAGAPFAALLTKVALKNRGL